MSLQRGLYSIKAGTHLGKSSDSAIRLTGFKSYNSACGDNPLLFIKYLQTLSHLALVVSSTGNTLSSAVCLTCSLPVSCLFNLIFPGDIGASTPPGTSIICFSSMALFTNWLLKAVCCAVLIANTPIYSLSPSIRVNWATTLCQRACWDLGR